MFGIKKAITCVALAMMSMAPIAAAEDMVAMLLPENVNPRWESQDAAFFVKHMKDMAPNIQVEVFNANNDTAAQQRQAEQALSRGAKVLVVIPIDGEAAAIIADMAADEGVPTIAYDRMVQSTNTSFWVQADLRASGRAQAAHIVANTEFGDTLVMLKGSPTDPNAPTIYHGQMDVLESLFASGEQVLGYENWTQGWDPAVCIPCKSLPWPGLRGKPVGLPSASHVAGVNHPKVSKAFGQVAPGNTDMITATLLQRDDCPW